MALPYPHDTFGMFTIIKGQTAGKSEVLTSFLPHGEADHFDLAAFLGEVRTRLVADLSMPPDLMTTTTAPPRWMPGDFKPSWSIAELRAFGLGWREIEDLTMASPVRWEPGERERLMEKHDEER